MQPVSVNQDGKSAKTESSTAIANLDKTVSREDDDIAPGIFGASASIYPKLLALIASCAAIAAISHDASYFLMVGLDFVSVFTTSDFIRSTIIWIPPVFIPCVLFLWLGKDEPAHTPFLDNFIDHGLISKAAIRSHLEKVKHNKFNILLFIWFPLMSLFLMNIYMGISIILFMIVVIVVARSAIKKRRLREWSEKERQYYLSMYIALMIAMMSGLAGISDGYSDLMRNRPVYVLEADKLSSPLVILMRSGEKGVLTRQGDRITFVPWDNVKSLTRIIKPANEKSIVGSFIDLFKRIEAVDP